MYIAKNKSKDFDLLLDYHPLECKQPSKYRRVDDGFAVFSSGNTKGVRFSVLQNKCCVGERVDSMQTVIVVVHLLIVIVLVGIILLQHSEGGGLGIGGSAGFMMARGTDCLSKSIF